MHSVTKKRLLLIMSIVFLISCNKDNNSNSENLQTEAKGEFFLGVTGEQGGEFIMLTDNLENGELNISSNAKELEMTGYLWSFNKGVAVGMVYQQGNPGIGYAFTADSQKKLSQIAKFQVNNRFTSFGFFDNYFVTSVAGQTPANEPNRNDGASFTFRNMNNGFSIENEKTILTTDLTQNGEQSTFSAILDMGNGEFLAPMVNSQYNQRGQGNGSSTGEVTSPNEVWVATFDRNLNVKRIYKDTRISYSSGRFRSQYSSQIAKAENGNIYVFSGSFEPSTSLPAGALRIKPNATEFDPEYYFNIEEKTNGFRFKRVWHISGNKFLLEIYTNKGVPSAVGEIGQFGIVDMENKEFKMITGIPARNQIASTGIPLSYNGKIYIPITKRGETAAVYVVNIATAQATKGISISGASDIRAIGRIAM